MSIPLEVDYYAILEIHEGADADEVKRAFRRLSLLRHPDKNLDDPDAHAAFCTLNEAHDTLKDASRRILYNAKYPSIKSKWKDFYSAQERERAKQEGERAAAERSRKEYREREEAKRMRAEEEKWERGRILHIREELAKVEEQISTIEEAARERVRLEKTEKGWWGYMTTGWGKKAKDIEDEKIKRDRENLQKLASERIKIGLLEAQRIKLQQDEKIQLRIMRENVRVRRERDTQAREAKEAAERKRAAEERQSQEEERKRRQRETQAQEAREAAERQRAAEQREAQEKERKRKQWEAWAKAFQEKEAAEKIAKEKAKERAAAARAAAEKEREAREALLQKVREVEAKAAEKEREAREALLKKVREAEAQAESTKGRKQNVKESTPKSRESLPRKGGGTRRRGPATQTEASVSGQGAPDSSTNPRHGVCVHSGFWPKVQGKYRCAICTQDFYSFILQCPTCSMMACASCKKQLKVGRKGKFS